MKIIEHDSKNPYFNLAVDEYYFKKAGESYFRLWQNDNTIVIGKNQNPYNEINLEVIKENNVTVARRMTGGGAVYHDLGNINFSFMTSSWDDKYDFKRFNRPIIKALESFGVKAVIQGRNDIAVNRRKISGCAQYLSGGRVLHHGTLLVNSDLEFIGRCLTASKDKLLSNSVASVRSRVANISDFLNDPPSTAVFMDRLKEFFINDFKGCSIMSPTAEDLQGINSLKTSKYETWDWIYGSSPKYNYSVKRRFDGCGGINICLNVKNGIIADCRIYGDFFGSGDISDIEEIARGARHEYEEICSLFKKVDIPHYFRNLSYLDFVQMFKVSD